MCLTHLLVLNIQGGPGSSIHHIASNTPAITATSRTQGFYCKEKVFILILKNLYKKIRISESNTFLSALIKYEY